MPRDITAVASFENKLGRGRPLDWPERVHMNPYFLGSVGTAARGTPNLLFFEVALLSNFVELRFRVGGSIEVSRSSLA
jgi:hypothetical protein